MSFNSTTNPDVIKTAIDDVFMAEWNATMHPGYMTAESGLIFKQDTTDKAAEINRHLRRSSSMGTAN